jgi:adenine-specific DNA-methyltransferase
LRLKDGKVGGVCSNETYNSLEKDGFIEWKKVEENERVIWKVYQKHYIHDGVKYASNNWNDIDGNKKATREVNELFNRMKYFDHPKPMSFLQKLINISNANHNSVILDFFSGSATTAHASLKLNSDDGKNRSFICVQIRELTDEKSEAFKGGYKNICEIGKERIRRAGKKILSDLQEELEKNQAALIKLTEGKLLLEGDEKVEQLTQEIERLESTIQNLDTGFRVYRLDDSNMQDVYYRPQDYKQAALDLFADNVKPDRTPDDLLTQVMLDWGLPLSLQIDQMSIAGKQVFKVASNSLYACFDRDIDEAFAKEIAIDKPLRIVFRDSGFKDDTAKSNVKQLLKQLSPDTEMKVI